MSRLLLAAYFVEVGLLLVVVPWSSLWDRNFLLAMVPAVQEWALSHYVRGAISGLGVVNIACGAAEVVRFCAERWGSRSGPLVAPSEEPGHRSV